MAWGDLSNSELFVVAWKSEVLGTFKHDLAEMISKASPANQALLYKAFPDEVTGVQRFMKESGWWEKVQKKADQK